MTELIAFECIEPSNLLEHLLARLICDFNNALSKEGAKPMQPCELLGEEPEKQTNAQQQAIMGRALATDQAARHAHNRKP